MTDSIASQDIKTIIHRLDARLDQMLDHLNGMSHGDWYTEVGACAYFVDNLMRENEKTHVALILGIALDRLRKSRPHE